MRAWDGKIDGLGTDLGGRITSLDTELRNRIDNLDTRLVGKIDDLSEANHVAHKGIRDRIDDVAQELSDTRQDVAFLKGRFVVSPDDQSA